MTQEAATTARLMTAAKEALESYHDVHVDDDGALTFRHSEVPCAVQAMQLAEGLTVLSLTCVVAWDLPAEDALAHAVNAAREAGASWRTVARHTGVPHREAAARWGDPAGGPSL